MSEQTFLVQLSAHCALYLLPHIFFRRDRSLNWRWWFTGVPYLAATALLVTGFFGVTPSLAADNPELGRWLELASLPFAILSCVLIAATVATHTVPLALWHQDNDAPASIVTHGPYRWVRHPFYVAFILMLIGTALASPNVGTVAALVAGLLAMNLTAAREEQRLLASSFGDDYAVYRGRTGRFVPRLLSVRS